MHCMRLPDTGRPHEKQVQATCFVKGGHMYETVRYLPLFGASESTEARRHGSAGTEWDGERPARGIFRNASFVFLHRKEEVG